MKKLTYILAIALTMSILFGYYQCTRRAKHKADSHRYENNYQQAYNGYQSIYRVNKINLKRYHKNMDSLRKLIGLRIKDVHNTERIIYRYRESTPDTIDLHENDILFTDPVEFDFFYTKECLNITGQVIDTILIFDEINFTDSINIIAYQKRPHRFWFIRWGKPTHHIKGWSNCSDSLFIERFELIKE